MSAMKPVTTPLGRHAAHSAALARVTIAVARERMRARRTSNALSAASSVEALAAEGAAAPTAVDDYLGPPFSLASGRCGFAQLCRIARRERCDCNLMRGLRQLDRRMGWRYPCRPPEKCELEMVAR